MAASQKYRNVDNSPYAAPDERLERRHSLQVNLQSWLAEEELINRVPQTDSIVELATFWQSHDVTDFEDEMEEVAEPVFVRAAGAAIRIELPEKEFEAIKRIAQEQQINYATLI